MMRIVVVTVFVLSIGFASRCEAVLVGNSDFVGGTPTVTLPATWSIGVGTGQLPISGLFDGVSANPGNGRISFSGTDALSDTNFISISIDLITPIEINSLSIANDHGTNPNNEITSLTTIFTGGGASPIVSSGLDDDNINDIDSAFSGISVSPVTSVEFRITGSDSLAIELREFLLDAQAVPEPSAFLFLSAVSALGISVHRRNRRSV